MTQEPTPAAPPERRRYVTTREFFKALHEAGLLPEYPMVSRVVIDANGSQGTSVVRMFVDRIPGDALLDIPALMTAPAEAGRLDDPGH